MPYRLYYTIEGPHVGRNKRYYPNARIKTEFITEYVSEEEAIRAAERMKGQHIHLQAYINARHALGFGNTNLRKPQLDEKRR